MQQCHQHNFKQSIVLYTCTLNRTRNITNALMNPVRLSHSHHSTTLT